MRSYLRQQWRRYLVWRAAEGVVPTPEPPKPINKIAADDADVIAHAFSHIGTGDVG